MNARPAHQGFRFTAGRPSGTPGVTRYDDRTATDPGRVAAGARELGMAAIARFGEGPDRAVWANYGLRELLSYDRGEVTLDVAEDAGARVALMDAREAAASRRALTPQSPELP